MSDRRYWLMKSEPEKYSLTDLENDGSTYWDGVRNYQARNFMRDDMKPGDLVLYYHSNTKPPGVVGLARVTSEGYSDPSQFDEDHRYYDPKSNPENPRWIVVDVEFVAAFNDTVTLEAMKAAEVLDGMLVIRRGQRLSVQPVEPHHFAAVCDMAGVDASTL